MLWVVDGFAVGTPAQQWVDHFLIGHPRDGAWIRPAGWRHVLLNVQGGDNAALQERRTRFGLELAREMPEASAAVVAGQDDGAEPRGDVLDRVLAATRRGGVCLVHGLKDRSLEGNLRLEELALRRGVGLHGVSTGLGAIPLPGLAGDLAGRTREMLWAGPWQGQAQVVDAVASMAPWMPWRKSAAAGGQFKVTVLRCRGVWEALESGALPGDLLEAALSRTDNPQGETLRDGRTQDLWGKRLLPSLVAQPTWVTVEWDNGLRGHWFAADGAIGDACLGIRERGGRVVSTQLFRSAKPHTTCFSRLMAGFEKILSGQRRPWGGSWDAVAAGILAEKV